MKIYKKDIDKVVEILLNAKSELINDNDYYEFKNEKLLKNTFTLPEKWCVKNIGKLEPGIFFNKILKTEVYVRKEHQGNYLHNHDYEGNSYKSINFRSRISDNIIRKDFVEISLEQFLKYVADEY